MSMKVCKECGTELSSKAKTCPKCGLDQRSFYSKHKILMIIFAIVCIGAIGTALSGDENNNAIQTSGDVAETKVEEVITVDYKELHKEYMDNPISADAKYKGKTLKLTGKVDDIDREIAGNTYITFEIDFLEDIRITFKKSEESKVAQLKKGQQVTIKGKCTGTLLSTTVALADCEIIE